MVKYAANAEVKNYKGFDKANKKKDNVSWHKISPSCLVTIIKIFKVLQTDTQCYDKTDHWSAQ